MDSHIEWNVMSRVDWTRDLHAALPDAITIGGKHADNCAHENLLAQRQKQNVRTKKSGDRMTNADIGFLPATELAQLYRTKAFSPVELVQAISARSSEPSHGSTPCP